MKEPRYLAVELLNKTFKNNGYSNIQLNYGLEKSEMNDRDKRLCSVIYLLCPGLCRRATCVHQSLIGCLKKDAAQDPGHCDGCPDDQKCFLHALCLQQLSAQWCQKKSAKSVGSYHNRRSRRYRMIL